MGVGGDMDVDMVVGVAMGVGVGVVDITDDQNNSLKMKKI